MSTKFLTTLKHVYVKLRWLMDQGCVFIGHGLSQDFRIINLLPPPTQIIDTVTLFKKADGRKLSLRLLTAFFLHREIQTETHSSREDAVAALELYGAWQRMQADGTFEAELDRVYQASREAQWKKG